MTHFENRVVELDTLLGVVNRLDSNQYHAADLLTYQERQKIKKKLEKSIADLCDDIRFDLMDKRTGKISHETFEIEDTQ